MQLMINGKAFDVATEPDGAICSDSLRKAAGIPKDRPLLMQEADGSNRMIHPGQTFRAEPGSTCQDAPRHKRGT